MDDAITLAIGAETVSVPALSLASLRRAWPAIKGFGVASDMVEQAVFASEIVAAALAKTRPDLTAEEIRERTPAGRYQDLSLAIEPLMILSGLLSGEARAVETGTTIPTSTVSLPNSSPAESVDGEIAKT